MCNLPSTGVDNLLNFVFVITAVILIATGGALMLKGRKAKGAALAIMILVGGIAISSVSSPSVAQAADCTPAAAQTPTPTPSVTQPPAVNSTISLDSASWLAVGSNDSKVFTLTNITNITHAIDIVPTLTGDSNFVVMTNNCHDISPMASCQVTIDFSADPTSLIAYAGTVSFAGSNTNTVAASLSRAAYTDIVASSASVSVSQMGQSTITFTNTGAVDALGFSTAMTFPLGSDWELVDGASDDCAGITTLAAGAHCVVVIRLNGSQGATFQISATAINVSSAVLVDVQQDMV